LRRRPHKVMHLITDLRTGGAEAMLTRLATAEPRIADEIIVASLLPVHGDDGQLRMERLHRAGVRLEEVDVKRPLGLAAGLIRIARLIAAQQPEIVQGWMYYGDLAALLALVMSGRRRKTGLVWSIRCSTLDLARYGPVLRLAVKACTLLSGCADVVTANSAAGMKSHLALGYRPRRAEILANGIDVEEFKPDPKVREAMRRRLDVADDRIVIAHVARVDPMKDHDTFLAAMASLPELEAWAIGAGTERLLAMPNLVRLGRRDDVPALLAAADFVVSSSAFGEGFSNAIAEGMACGLPAIATDVGDAREIIGDSGLVVPPGDPRALAGAIAALAAEAPSARAARGATARRRIVERFSLDRAVARFSALYETLLPAPAECA